MSLITTAELAREGRFTAEEFNWEDASDFDFDTWLQEVVDEAAGEVEVAVGSTAYADTTTEPRAKLLKRAEMCRAMQVGLRRRMVILSSRPEEAPPPEFIDLDKLGQLMETYRDRYEELISHYMVTPDDRPGGAFAFVATGIDETASDTYDTIDFGLLEGQ